MTDAKTPRPASRRIHLDIAGDPACIGRMRETPRWSLTTDDAAVTCITCRRWILRHMDREERKREELKIEQRKDERERRQHMARLERERSRRYWEARTLADRKRARERERRLDMEAEEREKRWQELEPDMQAILTVHGNVDCRSRVPDGWTHIRRKRMGPWLRKHGIQYFPAFFGFGDSPIRYPKPDIRGVVVRDTDAEQVLAHVAEMEAR